MAPKIHLTDPNEKDIKTLDLAVTQLSVNTDEMRETPQHRQPVERPVLPKRDAQLRPKGRSFDIIHNPRPQTRLESTLKTPEPLTAPAALPFKEVVQIESSTALRGLEAEDKDESKGSNEGKGLSGSQIESFTPPENKEVTATGSDSPAAEVMPQVNQSSDTMLSNKQTPQKPHMFDVAEYHPELHSWTPHKQHLGWLWVSLLGLIVLAAVAAYFFVIP